MRTTATLVTLLAALWLPACATEKPAEEKEPEVEFPDVGWPRTYKIGDSEVVMFQPQLEAWEDYKHLPGRSALAVTLQKGDEPIYGAMYFDVTTETSFVERQVLMKDFEVEKIIQGRRRPQLEVVRSDAHPISGSVMASNIRTAINTALTNATGTCTTSV